MRRSASAAPLKVLPRLRRRLPARARSRGEDGRWPRCASWAACRTSGPASVGRDRDGQVGRKLVAARRPGHHPGHLVTRATAATERWTHPVVVKPVAAGSSRGVTWPTGRTRSRRPLDATRARPPGAGGDVVVGREVDVAVLRRVDGAWWPPPPWRSSSTGSSTDLSTAAARTSGSGPAGRSRRQGARDAAWRPTTPSAARRRPDRLLPHRRRAGLGEVSTVPGMAEHSQVPRMTAPPGPSPIPTCSDGSSAAPAPVMWFLAATIRRPTGPA